MSVSAPGLESRYLSRFKKLPAQTGTTLKNYDSAGNVTDHLVQARASLKTQEKNIKELYATAKELVIGIDTYQQMSGSQFVKNIPLPSAEVQASLGKQLGYVQLTMRFFHAGVLHFMEQNIEAATRIDHLEKLLEKVAEYDEDSDLIGEMQSIDLDHLEATERNEVIKDIASPPPSPLGSDVTKSIATVVMAEKEKDRKTSAPRNSSPKMQAPKAKGK